MKSTELTKTLLKKIILEELQLLQELVLADVKKRFQSKKFLKKFGEDKKEASEELLSLIPDGIHEKQKAEVLNWLISWAIKNNTSDLPTVLRRADFKAASRDVWKNRSP